MIVFRTPKGWTGPKFVDGEPVEGTWRAHQVPIADFKNPEHIKQLEDWMKPEIQSVSLRVLHQQTRWVEQIGTALQCSRPRLQ
jgi:phosphoketolase